MSIARILLAATMMVAAGCGGGRRTGDAGPTGDAEPDAPYVEETCPVDEDDTFCPTYAQAYCEGHFDCCLSDEEGVRYESMALCLQRTQCICASARRGSAFESGTVSYDATAGAAILETVRAAAADCAPASLDAIGSEGAFVGTLDEGADCSPSATDFSSLYSCAPGLECYVTDFGGETTPPTAECRRRRSVGEACDAIGMNCAPGLYCADGASIDDPGVCRALLPSGSACLSDYECTSDLCDEDTGLCTALDPEDTWCVDATFDE